MITNAEMVESYFGYWPEFTDGKIVSFGYEAPNVIFMMISYFDAGTNKGAKIGLQFSGVSRIDLSELRSENVIESLRVIEAQPTQLVLNACYGLAGRFDFETVAVVSLIPLVNEANA
jgi:Immunity protein 50